MRKKTIFVVLIIIIVLVITGILVFSSTQEKKKVKVDSKENINKPTNKKTKTKEIEDNYGDQDSVKIKYDQYVVANGYMGASDNVYYTKDNVLYHLKVSTNETTKLATGVKKLEDAKNTAKVYKGYNFKIITEDDYITYID